MAKGKFKVLKKFCNGERQPNNKVGADVGKPGGAACPIGAWYPGEIYDGQQTDQLLKEGLIVPADDYEPETTVHDLKEGEGLKVKETVVVDQKAEAHDEESEEDDLEEQADGEEEPEELDEEGEAEEEPASKGKKGKSSKKSSKR